MTETWILIAHTFRLPLLVTWEGSPDVAKVQLHPGIPWLNCQREAASEILNGVAFSQAEDWFVFKGRLESIAWKAHEGDDIESLVVWSPARPALRLPEGEMMPMGEKRTRESVEIREFLQAFIDSSGLRLFSQIEELETFYYLLMGFGQLYMLERQKAMPLVWGKVFAAPTRIGWQEGIHNTAYRKNSVPQGERISKRIYAAYARAMMQDSKTEWLRPEIVWQEAWRDCVAANESARKRNLSDTRYIALCDERIKKTIPLILEAYAQWKMEKRQKTMAQERPDVYISPELGRTWKRRRKQYNKALNSRWRRLVERLGIKRAQEYAQALAAKNAKLSAVPNLQPEEPDLRHVGGDLQNQSGQD